MTKAREALQDLLYSYTKHGCQRPVLICRANGGSVSLVSQCGEGVRSVPAVLKSAGGMPTLAALLHLHSKVQGCELPSIEIPAKDVTDTNCIFAVCGYPPMRSDYGMAYRNGVQFVIQMTLNGESACHRVRQNDEKNPDKRKPLVERDDKAGDTILGFDWAGLGDAPVRTVNFDDLVDSTWFDKFLSPNPATVRIPQHLGEEDVTEEMEKYYKLSISKQWHPHKATRDSLTWWALVSLYTSFTWAVQYPTYRSWSYLNRRKKNEIAPKQAQLEQRLLATEGEFLEGLNVSGLLLDDTLKPVGWGFNTNRINKTLHAETALVLAWLKGARDGGVSEFKNYTFLSPWRSCCMCSGWLTDVFRESKVIWFIDDPGLPWRHLDYAANYTGEVFLPRLLKENARKYPALGAISAACPWFEVMGMATHWDYNHRYLDTLESMRQVDKTSKTGEKEGPLKGPVDLFGSQVYFEHLEKAWDMTRKLPTSVVELLSSQGELAAYVNNIWALRRCVMGFDEM